MSETIRTRVGKVVPALLGASCMIAVCTGIVAAQQPLETETARLPSRGTALIGLTYEFQTSTQGQEHALPFTFEYGMTDRLALLIEPVFFTAIRPKSGRAATGLGDLEATLQFLVRDETEGFPALALAAEVKLPTARDTLIGTRRTDFTPYLIASKRIGKVDAHANLGYSFVGKPANINVQNTLNFALAVEDNVTARFTLMAEVLATTAAGSGGVENSTAPEIAGAEQVGMVGFRYAMRSRTWASLGVTYDNSNALLFRPGLTFETPF
ncbi:MAG: transporter [Gemmatimonadota bacterium]